MQFLYLKLKVSLEKCYKCIRNIFKQNWALLIDIKSSTSFQRLNPQNYSKNKPFSWSLLKLFASPYDVQCTDSRAWSIPEWWLDAAQRLSTLVTEQMKPFFNRRKEEEQKRVKIKQKRVQACCLQQNDNASRFERKWFFVRLCQFSVEVILLV